MAPKTSTAIAPSLSGILALVGSRMMLSHVGSESWCAMNAAILPAAALPTVPASAACSDVESKASRAFTMLLASSSVRGVTTASAIWLGKKIYGLPFWSPSRYDASAWGLRCTHAITTGDMSAVLAHANHSSDVGLLTSNMVSLMRVCASSESPTPSDSRFPVMTTMLPAGSATLPMRGSFTSSSGCSMFFMGSDALGYSSSTMMTGSFRCIPKALLMKYSSVLVSCTGMGTAASPKSMLAQSA